MSVSFLTEAVPVVEGEYLAATDEAKLTPDMLHQYQKQAVYHMLYHPDSMLWLQTGLGKTPITLTAIVDRMRAGQVKKTLIFGPLRVVQAVWAREARKWTHTRHLRFSVMHGTLEKRRRALFADADVYLCNYEGMNWLAEELVHYYLSQGKPLPFDMVVYDEVTKVKSSTSKRVAGGKRDVEDRWGVTTTRKITGWRAILDHFSYRVGLTGSPASNGYLDLHGQFLVVDGGARLGPYVTHFKDSYFSSDYSGWKYTPTERGKELIEGKIADITIKMDAKEHLPDMPDCITRDIWVPLPPKARKIYDEMEDKMFTALDSGTEVEVFNKASVSGKCLQIANGSVYHGGAMAQLGEHEEEHTAARLSKSAWEKVHDAKLDALSDIIEEAGGRPVLCAYAFKPDAERIMERFKALKPVNMTAAPSSQTEALINKWNSGGIKLMIGHPASMGHGIDGLQDSGSIVVWFGPNWSYELYTQLCARIDRQGQTRPVSIIRILAEDTVDLVAIDSLVRKRDDEEGLKDSLRRYRNRGSTSSSEYVESVTGEANQESQVSFL